MARLLLILLLTVGCASQERLRLKAASTVTADDYDDVLDDWTKNDEVYDILDSIIFVHATFHSPQFRQAFILAHPDVYGPGSEEAQSIALTDPTAEQYLEFFISAVTNVHRWNDMEKNDSSIWRVTLLGDSEAPVFGQVERVKTTANIRRIYPYITDFAKTYRVRFPLTVDGKPIISSQTSEFTLRIASALGEARMTWLLAPESRRAN